MLFCCERAKLGSRVCEALEGRAPVYGVHVLTRTLGYLNSLETLAHNIFRRENYFKSIKILNCKDMSILDQYMQSHGWAQFPLKHYWNIGYQNIPIVLMMNELPPPIAHLLNRLSDVINDISEASSSTLKYIFHITGGSKETRNIYTDMLLVSLMQNEDILGWEEDIHPGLVKITYDSANQNRDMIFANSKAARFWKLSKTDFLGCIANNNLCLPFNELDWLSSFAV